MKLVLQFPLIKLEASYLFTHPCFDKHPTNLIQILLRLLSIHRFVENNKYRHTVDIGPMFINI